MMMAIGVYAFVKTHQIVYLRSDYFITYKFYLKQNKTKNKSLISLKYHRKSQRFMTNRKTDDKGLNL